MNKKKTRTKTTYGVYNLIEWHALLRMGKATVKIPFTGGGITTQGVTPATFTTEDPVIQFAIERSPEFRVGKIKVVRRVNLKDVIEIECNAPKGAQEIPPIPAEETSTPAKEVAPLQDTQTDNATSAEEKAQEAPATTQVEFACNDDAKDYLEETFGVKRSKLKTREDIVKAGKAHKVEIIFV